MLIQILYNLLHNFPWERKLEGGKITLNLTPSLEAEDYISYYS